MVTNISNLKSGYAIRDVDTQEWLEDVDENEWSGTPHLDYTRVKLFDTEKEACRVANNFFKRVKKHSRRHFGKCQKNWGMRWNIIKLTPVSVDVIIDVKCNEKPVRCMTVEF